MHRNDGRNTIHGTSRLRPWLILPRILSDAYMHISICSCCSSGGDRGFSRSIWTVKEYVAGGESPYITFYYRSFDGEQGTSSTTAAR
jgi:hypothetical protein